MLKLKKIAVTGSVASGKSSVVSFLRDFGAFTLECDQIVHDLFISNPSIQQQVIALLGKKILVNGLISREKIATIVFENPQKLGELERIVHPFVLKEILSVYYHIKKSSQIPLFVVEVPLFFESPLQALREFFDYCVLVILEEKLAKKRFPKSDFAKRQKRFLPCREKEQQADFLIENNGSKEHLKLRTHQLYEKLIKL